jgi:hypothetical protein
MRIDPEVEDLAWDCLATVCGDGLGEQSAGDLDGTLRVVEAEEALEPVTDLVTEVGRLALAGLTRRARPTDADLDRLAGEVVADCGLRFDLGPVGGRQAVHAMLRSLAAGRDVDADPETLAVAVLVCAHLVKAGRARNERWTDHLDLLVEVLRRDRSEPAPRTSTGRWPAAPPRRSGRPPRTR